MKNKIAQVFRKFSAGESPSMEDLQLAVKYLLRLKGFSKTEEDVWNFFGDCYTWFRKKETLYAAAGDDEVVSRVAYRFKRWTEDQRKRTEPIEGQPWRAGQLVVADVEDDDEQPGLCIRKADHKKSWKDLVSVSKVDLAEELKELKTETSWLKRLRRTCPDLYRYHFKRLVEAETIRDPESRPSYNVRRLQDALKRQNKTS